MRRSGAATLPALPASAGVLRRRFGAAGFLAAAIWLLVGCYSAPPLYRVITLEDVRRVRVAEPFAPGPAAQGKSEHGQPGEMQPVGPKQEQPAPAKAKQPVEGPPSDEIWVRRPSDFPFLNGGFAALPYARGTRALLRTEVQGVQLELNLLEASDLRERMKVLRQGLPFNRLRVPELFPVRFRIRNQWSVPVAFSPERLRLIAERPQGALVAGCISLRQYYEREYTAAVYPLLYEWGLAPRPLRIHLHPLPDYVVAAGREFSGSPDERDERRERFIRLWQQRLAASAHVPPGQAVEGVCLFPRLAPGRYRLLYEASEQVAPRVALPPLAFRVHIASDEDGAVQRAGRPAAAETDAPDRLMRDLEHDRAVERRRFQNRLHRLHRRLHDHARLRRERRASSGARTGPGS